jgi:hypothetical protein
MMTLAEWIPRIHGGRTVPDLKYAGCSVGFSTSGSSAGA